MHVRKNTLSFTSPEKYFFFHIYEVITWEKYKKSSANHCLGDGGVSLEYVLVCVYTYTRVRVYTHTCAHSVYMWRDVRMQMQVLVYTHTSRHASMCMHVCVRALPTAA